MEWYNWLIFIGIIVAFLYWHLTHPIKRDGRQPGGPIV